MKKNMILLSMALILAVTSIFNYVSAKETIVSKDLIEVQDREANKLNIDEWLRNTNKIQSVNEQLLKYSENLVLDEKKRYIVKKTGSTENYYFVYFPINGSAEKDSKYYIIFNDKGVFQSDILLLGLKEKDNLIHAVVHNNGQVVFDALLQENGSVESGFAILSDNTKQEFSKSTVAPKGWWSCFNNCLASQGVAAWAITVVSTMCGVACAATFGIGCAICFGGITVVSGSVVGYCSGTCQKDPDSY